MNEIPTPRTDAGFVATCAAIPISDKDAWYKRCLRVVNDARTLERELEQARQHLDFLKSKGLTVGLMKSSDKPEPYLMYVCEPDSEFDDTIYVNKLIEAEQQRDSLRQQLNVANSFIGSVAESLGLEPAAELPEITARLNHAVAQNEALRKALKTIQANLHSATHVHSVICEALNQPT